MKRKFSIILTIFFFIISGAFAEKKSEKRKAKEKKAKSIIGPIYKLDPFIVNIMGKNSEERLIFLFI